MNCGIVRPANQENDMAAKKPNPFAKGSKKAPPFGKAADAKMDKAMMKGKSKKKC